MNIALLQASFPFTNPMRNAMRLLDLVRGAREAIKAGRFDTYKTGIEAHYQDELEQANHVE